MHLLIGTFVLAGIPFLVHVYFYYPPKGFFAPNWTSGDFLSYYGFVVGSAATIYAVIKTINYSKREVELNNIALQNEAHFTKIKELFDNAILSLDPAELHLILLTDKLSASTETLVKISKYKLDSRKNMNALMLFLSFEEAHDLNEIYDMYFDHWIMMESAANKLIAYYEGIINNQGQEKEFREKINEIFCELPKSYFLQYKKLLDKERDFLFEWKNNILKNKK